MAKRKRRRRRTQPGSGISPQAVQIIQRKTGGRRPERAEVLRALLEEAGRKLDKAQFGEALDLTEQAARLARSDDERGACNSLLAEIYFQRAPTQAGPAHLDDLHRAVKLAPQKPLYRLHLAHALERHGKPTEALTHYRAANQVWKDGEVGYLWCIAALKSGQPLPRVRLTAAEQNTLDIVQRLVTKPARFLDPKLVRATEPVLDGSLPVWQALVRMLADEKAAPVKDLDTAVSRLNGTEAAGIVHYYRGVAALRASDLDTAWRALTEAREAGYVSPWLQENWSYLARAQAIQQAEAADWQGVVRTGEPILKEVDDRILAETVGLAHFHLGYYAAQAGDWAAAVSHWQQAGRYVSSRYLAQNLAVAREQQEDWQGAAEAWRDMVRRRPKKKDHPDYLDDNQVASLWRHAAECYKRADNVVESITCLRNGLKYAPDNIELRLELSEALMANEQFDAAEKELNHLLERDADNVTALVLLGQLYRMDGWWSNTYKAVKVLKRALELDPNQAEAREMLGAHYVEQGGHYVRLGMYKQAAEQYREGLQYLPNYPLLYVKLSEVERYQGHKEAARGHLLQAYALEPDRTPTVGPVLHELLHLKAREDVERLLPEIRQMPGLLPGFWTDQGEQVLACKLGREWAERFFEEALALVGQPWVPDSRAEVLVEIIITLFNASEGTSDLGQRYRRRVSQEVPNSGAREFIEGLIAAFEKHNLKKAGRLLDKAWHKARKAGEEGLLHRIEQTREFLYTPPADFLPILERMILGRL